MGNLTEFEQLTLNQIMIERGTDKPSCDDIKTAKRVVKDCNFYRRFKGLKEF